MDGDMDGVPALLDSLLDERLSLGRAKRMLYLTAKPNKKALYKDELHSRNL